MIGAAAVGTTVLDVLERLDSDFATVADAVENGEFALWVGSGISGRAPSLGVLVGLAFEFLRKNAIDPAKESIFRPALGEAVEAAEVSQDDVEPHLGIPFASWPNALHDKIVNTLWNKYSVLLDIRIEGEDDDLILWTGIDIRKVFENPEPPAAEHLCIALLILEGAVSHIASANWGPSMRRVSCSGSSSGLWWSASSSWERRFALVSPTCVSPKHSSISAAIWPSTKPNM